ncbi:hypothetical protein [[Kitasatospora] papulosa]|uniref:hypothetical protein n=1 Tax=[Kitasatospora] papulosa TaxID=1464011 RepID=UPI003682E901
MSTTTDPDKTRAIRELDRLTSRYQRAEETRDDRRDALHAAIVKHLKARNAAPGIISDHTPYDRVHVGRIGKAGGVEPLIKGEKVTYAPEAVAAATAELDELTSAFTAAEGAVDKARDALHPAIAKHYSDRHIGPGEIAEHTPYKRNRILQIAREAGAPRIRP